MPKSLAHIMHDISYSLIKRQFFEIDIWYRKDQQ